MLRRAIYPGSFDPIHLGHLDIIERVSKQFDELVVLVSDSTSKTYLFSATDRMNLVKKELSHLKNVKVDSFSGLTVDYAKKKDAQVIIRGLRAVVDFEYEMTMSSMNQKLNDQIETMLVFARPEFYYYSSRGVKEIASHGGDLSGLVSPSVMQALHQTFRNKG